MYFAPGEKKLIEEAKREVKLTKKLLVLLDTAPVSIFFHQDEESSWDEFQAWDAWTFWIMKNLEADEKEMYERLYGDECFDIVELRSRLSVDSNRIPGPGNVDGY